MMIKRSILYLILCVSNFSLMAQQGPLVFFSDTQNPLWMERTFLKSEHNKKASDVLFERSVAKNPAAIFFMGDLVGSGSKKKAWKRIDVFLGNLKKKGIPYYATMGNHDYMFNAKKGIRNFNKRYTSERAQLSLVCVDSIAVILINSNLWKLAEEEKQKMLTDYSHLLDSLDHAIHIKGIVVGTHHSPFTNNAVIASSKEVRDNIVPPFIKAKKTLLFLSGHSHFLELFKEQGKHFCVIGGGGGLKQKLKRKPLFQEIGTPKLRFFYCTLQQKDGMLVLDAWGMNQYKEPEQQISILKIPFQGE